MNKYKIVISSEAYRMLTEHMFFMAKVNPEAADNLKVKIMNAIRSLETMPERFPYLDQDDRRSLYRKMPVPDKHLIIYIVHDGTVFVEYILDCRQDYSWLL